MNISDVISSTSPDSNGVHNHFNIDWSEAASRMIHRQLFISNKETTSLSEIAAYTVFSLVLAWIVVSLINSLVQGCFFTSAWAVIHQIQLILVVLILEPDLTVRMKHFIEWLNFTLLNFNFIKLDQIDYISNWQDSSQEKDILRTLDLESRSTLLNHVSFVAVLIALLLVHIIVELFMLCIRSKQDQGHNRCSGKAFKYAILHLFRSVLYTRLIWLVQVSTLLSAAEELNKFKFDTLAEIVSIFVAIFASAVGVFFLTASIVFIIIYRKGSNEDQYSRVELMSGIKSRPLAWSLIPFHFFRIIAFVVIVIFLIPEQRIAAYTNILSKHSLF